MAKKTNSLKNNKSSAPRKPTKKKRSNPVKSLSAFFKNDKLHRITGLFLLLFSIILVIAITSYFLSWKSDDYLKSGDEARNWIGYSGRAISKLFVEHWFGIASFGFPWLFFIFGIKLLLKKNIVPLWKSTRLTILGMVWLSLTLGYFWGENDSLVILGGEFGRIYAYDLKFWLGNVGAGFLLLFILLSFLIISYNFSFDFLNTIKWPKKKDSKQNSKTKGPKEDIYNTVEYSVTEDEEQTGNIIKPVRFEENEKDNDGPEELIVLDPSISDKKDSSKEIASDSSEDIELTVEKPAEETTVSNGEAKKKHAEHFSVDEPYDPWLDLADYKFPGLDLLESYGKDKISVEKDELERNKNRIVETLDNYAIKIQKIKATIGPTVTLYEIVPAPGIRISKIKNLEDDIALGLAALGIRIIAPIPGKGTIGIEVPNQNPDIVSMRSVLASDKFQNTKFELPFGMGKTISNESFVADLTKMPHLLMAGATGQGKSVGLNAIITSLLYKKHPSELKFVMVDPKKVELTLYSKIERHFLAKLPDSEEAIITDTRKVVRTLNSLGIEMDNRYELLKDAQVRNIKEYNAKFKQRKLSPTHGHRFLPYIVLVIDEFADLIMTAGKEIEVPITRLAQLARAVGIHLIIATQRPSVNIITGSIKANFPARVAFRVISKIDSRTILDTGGADQLIGRGDMLFSTGSDLLRLQCAFVDTPEIDKLTDFIGSQRAFPDAMHLPEFDDEETETVGDYDASDRDELFEDAAKIIVQTQQGSTSLLQRKLKLGYNRAGRIIDQLEAAGIVGPFEGSKAREVRVANEVALEQFLKDLEEI